MRTELRIVTEDAKRAVEVLMVLEPQCRVTVDPHCPSAAPGRECALLIEHTADQAVASLLKLSGVGVLASRPLPHAPDRDEAMRLAEDERLTDSQVRKELLARLQDSPDPFGDWSGERLAALSRRIEERIAEQRRGRGEP